jgi:hypothetical protein
MNISQYFEPTYITGIESIFAITIHSNPIPTMNGFASIPPQPRAKYVEMISAAAKNDIIKTQFA